MKVREKFESVTGHQTARARRSLTAHARRMAPLSELLESAKLGHLADVLGAESLDFYLASLEAQGRPTFIKSLKEAGVAKLSERQALATLIAKAAKSGSAAPPERERASGLRGIFSNMLLAKDFTVSEPNFKGFRETLKPLARLGESAPLKGETAPRCRPEACVRLIALYGTGHDASVFERWQAGAPKWLEVRVVELPGHGTRSEEPLWACGHRVAADATASDEQLAANVSAERDAFIRALADELSGLVESGAPYAVYGFSSGAMFGYLLIHEWLRRRAPLPFRFFAAGRGAPHVIWAPDGLRTLRSGSEAEVEAWLHRGLAVPLLKVHAHAHAHARVHACTAGLRCRSSRCMHMRMHMHM